MDHHAPTHDSMTESLWRISFAVSEETKKMIDAGHGHYVGSFTCNAIASICCSVAASAKSSGFPPDGHADLRDNMIDAVCDGYQAGLDDQGERPQ